ncbi:response regulator transcription factor [Actinopolyspora mortivallis]|nr:LuxR C-terminal-related transcriptional regulator [Actinopolyspora mortivallis]
MLDSERDGTCSHCDYDASRSYEKCDRKSCPEECLHVSGGMEELIPDERDILALLVRCSNDEQIARNMFMSVRTVRRRISKIMSVLGAENRFAAGVAASELGWVYYSRSKKGGSDKSRFQVK